MDIDAFEMEQNGKKLYLAVMTVEQLKDESKVKVDEWSRSNPTGYQRRPTESRINAFGRYIGKAKGISPLSITLSARDKIDFEKKKGNYGVLKIADDTPLYIVDGQHRMAGFRTLIEDNPEYLHFPIPIVIMPMGDGKSGSLPDAIFEEAKQFVIINRTAKGVRSDLAERFLTTLQKKEGINMMDLPAQVTRGIEWVPKASEVIDELNKSGAWEGRIRLPNEEKKGITVVRQKSFSDSLKPIMTNISFDTFTVKDLASLLNAYWTAISELCPEAFADPDNYEIQKTAGVFVLHRLFPSVLAYSADSKGVVTKDSMKKILGKMDQFNSEYWGPEGDVGMMGTSQKAFGILYMTLKESLDSVAPKSSMIKPFSLE